MKKAHKRRAHLECGVCVLSSYLRICSSVMAHQILCLPANAIVIEHNLDVICQADWI